MVRVGQRLHRERLTKKLSLEDIAKATKIKARFLAAIERGEYSKLPSPAYAQGFVRNYASYLGLPKAEITALFRREFDEKKAYQVLPDSLIKTQEFPLKRIRIQESLIIIGVVLVLILIFLAFQYRYVFLAPALNVSSPSQGVTTSSEITVTGKTDNNASVYVNNELVSLNSKGEFSKRLSLFSGKSVITVKAKNRMGKETVLQREITVK
jgi:cytoskeletal protein RodZ